MEYHQEVLNRATGQIETRSLGEWITVTELGRRHGVGPRKVRAILHHMGVLGREGRSYRLPRDLVESGIGRRHDRPKSGHSFDVISPEGRRLIDSMWSETVEDYEADCRKNSSVQPIRDALAAFKSTRTDELGTAGEVRWIEDHFPGTLHKTIAEVLEVSPALVTRHTKQRAAQIEHCKRMRGRDLLALGTVNAWQTLTGADLLRYHLSKPGFDVEGLAAVGPRGEVERGEAL